MGQGNAWDTYFDDLAGRAGESLGSTDWFSLDQKLVDVYGALVEDLDPMHNAPEWEPGIERWGGTIVIGTNVLSMVPDFLRQCGMPVDEPAVGFNLVAMPRVRFISPLRIDQRARGHVELIEATRAGNGWRVATRHLVEREGEQRPFMSADAVAEFDLEPRS